MEQLIGEKLSAPKIAKRLGVSESVVRRALKKHGLKTFRFIDRDADAKTKTCRYCNETKAIEDFPVAAVIKDQTYYRNKCNKCYVAMKSRRRQGIFDWVSEVKRTLECKHCGTKDHRVLEFHHNDGEEKIDNVSSLAARAWGIAKIQEEIDKCTVLCANCHRILHYEERNSQ